MHKYHPTPPAKTTTTTTKPEVTVSGLCKDTQCGSVLVPVFAAWGGGSDGGSSTE